MTAGQLLLTHEVDHPEAKGKVDVLETIYGLEIRVNDRHLAHIDLFYLANGLEKDRHPTMQIYAPYEEDPVLSLHWFNGSLEVCIEREESDIHIHDRDGSCETNIDVKIEEDSA